MIKLTKVVMLKDKAYEVETNYKGKLVNLRWNHYEQEFAIDHGVYHSGHEVFGLMVELQYLTSQLSVLYVELREHCKKSKKLEGMYIWEDKQ